MLCETEIFIEVSISVRNLFSRKSYNGFWSGALKLVNYPFCHTPCMQQCHIRHCHYGK